MKRRNFIKTTATVVAAPMIVPSFVLGENAPSNKITVGQIGCGRIARDHDLPETMKYDVAQVVAVSDVDSKRLGEGKQFVEGWYARNKNKKINNVKTYDDYKDLLADKDIDAVIISTPDHWHAQPAIEAALAGKDIYLQKPASLTIAEGRIMSNTIHRTGRILQIGSQQRSMPQFRIACELVRNGRIGQVHTIKIGLPGDPSGPEEPEMPIPANLNYDMWLGSTPYVYYTEKRVHPQHNYSRPGWLRCEQFGAGMITGWGAHHLDTANWGMGTEYTGPIEVEATAEFPTSGLWDVHGPFYVTAKFANGVTMLVSGDFPNGVRFEGDAGWIFVTRGGYSVTASDPVAKSENAKALTASDPKILESKIGADEIHLQVSEEQHGDWLNSIKTRKPPVAPAEVGVRACTNCLISHIAMKLPRKLYWDPQNERFINDDEANAMLSRPQRFPYGTDYIFRQS
ncbi:gfo/Idh/MocA family oxidoreductase [candidate division KSB1 bacterium]|nr:Gfo/Idh/MocA family oxidoreductase [candidate division KSB1 bacterium]RQW02176.1 MAG: gfo/Idh/MocA family oxidoreductase [candidate division KSB1 bacterium]